MRKRTTPLPVKNWPVQQDFARYYEKEKISKSVCSSKEEEEAET
jgi:hypothetical protein